MEQGLRDLTSVRFTREGYTYDIDYEYLSRNSPDTELYLLKGWRCYPLTR